MRGATLDERLALIGDTVVDDKLLWTREQVAAFLGCKPRTVDGLPIPRANIGGPKYVPSVVLEWAKRQLDHQLPER
ncbi:MAG TPA: hypothetical protein VFW98_08225 [Gemmatimonadaceae bacterium]|nr:hypothetical protein [Gemmatimonadaceae bacterium]